MPFLTEPEKLRTVTSVWDELFSKRRKRDIDGDMKIKEDHNPTSFVCLKCGVLLSRGRESAKKRHFLQKHKDLDVKLAMNFIVPEDHVDAKKILKKTPSARNNNKPQATISLKQSIANVDLSATCTTTHPTAGNIQMVMGKKSETEHDVDDDKYNVENGNGKSNTLEKLQTDVNQIKVILSNIAVNMPHQSNNSKTTEEIVLQESLRKVKSLTELQTSSSELLVEKSDEKSSSIRVTCKVCFAFLRHSATSTRSLLKNTWGTGVVYNAEKAEMLHSGENPTWYSFKDAVIDHLCCHPTRSAGQYHLKAKIFRNEQQKEENKRLSTNMHVVSAGLQVIKMKAAGLQFESMIALLSFCGTDVGNIGHGRNLFPDIVNASYWFLIDKISNFLRTELPSTGLRPHFSIAVDKSTPHRETNHAVLIIVPVGGVRVAIPIDAPIVYGLSENNIVGGSGEELANQIINVLEQALNFGKDDLTFARAVHADGQYQASTFQNRVIDHFDCDPYFLMPWDTAHWLDRVMEKMREKTDSSNFFKRLIKRSNRLHTMFGIGRGFAEYLEHAKACGFEKPRVTVTFATTRFFSSAITQWKRILDNYQQLLSTYIEYREDIDDDCDETKFEVRGQDFVIDLCGVIDVFAGVVSLMENGQRVNLPPWKVSVWFPKVQRHAELVSASIRDLLDNLDDQPNEFSLPRLAGSWEDISKDVNATYKGITLKEGWLITESTEEVNDDGIKERRYEWTARSSSDSLADLLSVSKTLNDELAIKYSHVQSPEASSLGRIFDVDQIFQNLSIFSLRDGVVVPASREGRIKWETDGDKEFSEFWSTVCTLPQVTALSEEDATLCLMPHDSAIIFRRFKKTIHQMIFKNKYGILSSIFKTENDEDVKALKDASGIVSIRVVKQKRFSLENLYEIGLLDGSVQQVKVDEESFFSAFYIVDEVFLDVGKEFCIALDTALGGSGCEAVVEGFYSLVKAHKKAGGQSNDVLVRRSVVDWLLPEPIACESVVKGITKVYLNGDEKRGLKKHRHVKFFDRSERTSQYERSKVIDRIKGGKNKFASLFL